MDISILDTILKNNTDKETTDKVLKIFLYLYFSELRLKHRISSVIPISKDVEDVWLFINSKN
jgi:hypothetical protein